MWLLGQPRLCLGSPSAVFACVASTELCCAQINRCTSGCQALSFPQFPPHKMDKIKEKIAGFKDAETGKTGASGVFSEGKDRYQDYKTDAADGKVNWMQQGKDALKDYKADTQGNANVGPQGNVQ